MGHKKEGNSKKTWSSAQAFFNGIGTKESLEIEGNPVMEAWEEPYMKVLADKVTDNLPQGGGTFLEVGYGLGLSAKVIQSKFPKSHTIIEANADVFCRLMEENPGTIGLKGLWQDVVGHLRSGYFDGILYDPYIISEDDPAHHISFAFEAYRLLKPGGIFTFCNLTHFGERLPDLSYDMTKLWEEQLQSLGKIGFSELKWDVFDLGYLPPKECSYYDTQYFLVPCLVK